MRLLRSEEEALPAGAVVGVAQLHELARRWYGDRLDAGWRPRDPAASQRILDEVGLRGGFWRLPVQ
jgi:hypothetical protein